MNSDFEKTERILLEALRKIKKEDIAPPEMLKMRLDKALSDKRKKSAFFALRIPVYQAAAAAAAFFVLGFSTQFLRPAELPEIVYQPNEVEVIKYIDRPVKQIEYKTVFVEKPAPQHKDLARVEHVDTYGISLADDSILQRMLVTIY